MIMRSAKATSGDSVACQRNARVRWWPAGLTSADLAVLRVWLISRCAVLALSWPAMWILQASSKTARPWLGLWEQWDAVRFQAIAQYGYFGPAGHVTPHQVAFFPGFPLVLAVAHVLIRQWTVAGLLISFVAGGIAMVALGRIADRDYQPGSGHRAVLYLVASPAAIFLAVGYAESLFLAFALCAWLAARGGRWPVAMALAGGATVIRSNGFFLCAALLVEVIWRAGENRRKALVAFPLALLPVAGYELYLRASTGDWLAWQHAETAGWQRRFTSPLTAFHTTWTAAFGHEFTAPVAFVFQLELLAVLAGVAVTVALAARRRWPEAVYAGLTIGVLATSVWYESVPRALLLIWPLWCGLAALAGRRAWTGQLYLALSIPACAAIGLLYLSGNWAG
jgi:Mannosyltransferase (PIG-V)